MDRRRVGLGPNGQRRAHRRRVCLVLAGNLAGGGRYTTVRAGAQLAAFSFHPRKLITTGEGGMVITPDPAVAARIRRLREHGMDVTAAERHGSRQPVIERYTETGFNFRMTDMRAAVGLAQLRKLGQMVVRPRELAVRYQRLLSGIVGLGGIADQPYGGANFQSFWILLPDDSPVSRDDMLRSLASADTSPRRGIMAAHLEPAYAGNPHAPLPVSERPTARSLMLPLFHEMTQPQQDKVASHVLAQPIDRPAVMPVVSAS